MRKHALIGLAVAGLVVASVAHIGGAACAVLVVVFLLLNVEQVTPRRDGGRLA